MSEISYFKRFRMELELHVPLPPVPPLPAGYFWLPWDDVLLTRHAEVKFGSFQDEIDSQVFPSLGTYGGCVGLMQAIRGKSGFIPGATWLVAQGIEYCGTVQGVRERNGHGAIQNLGVIPPTAAGASGWPCCCKRSTASAPPDCRGPSWR